MNRVVHFEIQADDPERAMKFYRDVFGWSFRQWLNAEASPDRSSDIGGEQKYWMIMTDSTGSPQAAGQVSTEPGINGGLLPRPAKTPPKECGTNAFVCTVQVENFDEMAKKIAAAGGVVAMPKFAFPGMAWQVYFLDTEGNTFGVHQPDVNAK